MTGTLGGALEARRIAAGEGRLAGEGAGEVEVEDGVLVLRRIHVRYELAVEPGTDRAAVERAFEHHPRRCPVYRSISPAIAVTTELQVREL